MKKTFGADFVDGLDMNGSDDDDDDDDEDAGMKGEFMDPYMGVLKEQLEQKSKEDNEDIVPLSMDMSLVEGLLSSLAEEELEGGPGPMTSLLGMMGISSGREGRAETTTPPPSSTTSGPSTKTTMRREEKSGLPSYIVNQKQHEQQEKTSMSNIDSIGLDSLD